MRLIEISGKVAAALRSDDALRSMIGDRFFPVVAIQGVKGYPFVTYRNLGISHNDNKDIYGELTGKIELEVAAQSYESASKTSGEIQRVLEAWSDGIEFRMTNYEEEFDPQIMCYISVLTFDYDED